MKIINWGLIGAGNISSIFALALKGMEDTNLAAVASRNPDKAKAFAEKFSIHKAYGSYEELVKDPDIDVIYIGTPHTEHKVNAELCLKNGKAVLCEKPFALNEKETKYLIELAREKQVFLMEAMWTKFLPVTNKVKEWIKEGRIGQIKKLDISFGFCCGYNEDNRLFNPALAGGALLDVGVYPITYAIDLMGTLPEQVVSSASVMSNGIDEQNCMIFKFAGGTIAALSSAITANVGENAVIIGTSGKIQVSRFWEADKAVIYDTQGNLMETYQEEHRINGYEFEAYEVNRCLREGRKESSRNPLQATLDIIKIMDCMRKEWGIKYQQEID